MSDEVTRQAAEASADRNVPREQYDWMVKNRDEWKQDRDEWKQCADTLERAAAVDASNVQRMTAEVHRLKDAGEQLIAECNRVSAERDAARAEAEGLRADLLAHPPELAAERQRHVELMEDFDRQAVTITMLQDALRRTENALKVAQAKHIDERLKGFLAVISQLADQAQDLLP